VNTSVNTNMLPKSTIRNRPVNTWFSQVSYADTRWPGVQMDHPVSGGHKHGGLIHKSVVGRGDNSFTLHNLVKKLQQIQAGRSENRRSSKNRRTG
jgi:hypothetical protein